MYYSTPLSEQTVRKQYPTVEVTARFTEILNKIPSPILPFPCDFLADQFNSALNTTLDAMAPLKVKKFKMHPMEK